MYVGDPQVINASTNYGKYVCTAVSPTKGNVKDQNVL